MEKILVGFSKPNKWKPFAWLIMVAFNIPYDHVYIKYRSDKYDRNLIYQASKLMVNFMGDAQFLSENVIVDEFQVDITEENKTAMVQFAIDNAGKPYGVKQIFGMAWVRINELLGRKITNPFQDEGQTYVCSELASYILQQYAGAQLPRDLDDMTPLDVFNYLTSLKSSQS
jgi:hypothetical protein